MKLMLKLFEVSSFGKHKKVDPWPPKNNLKSMLRITKLIFQLLKLMLIDSSLHCVGSGNFLSV